MTVKKSPLGSRAAFLKNYASSLLLIASIFIGAFLGLIFKEGAVALKPLGTIFLNLLFTAVVPLVFFSISSAVASTNSIHRLGKIFGCMILIFTLTGIVASVVMIIAVKIYPPAYGVNLNLNTPYAPGQFEITEAVIRAFSASDFNEILSKKNMLALIVFSLLIGLAASSAGEKAKPFVSFLVSGNIVMSKVISYIMLYAPVGLGAYFAYLVGVFGPQLMGSYLRAITLYYPLAILYFFVGFSFYVYLAANGQGVKNFWINIIPPSLTALATGSSIATIPANLEAAKKIGVPEDIREVVIPVGATIHMDGSCLSAVLKIAFLFGLFNMDFSGPTTILTAIGVALLSGTVMSGIPGGGFLGEMVIVTFYGFPIEAMPIISMIGTLVDPPATMVNATGDSVASMMVARILGGRDWINKS